MAEAWGTRDKPSAAAEFLLKEDSDYLLLENGDKIVLNYGEDWSTRIKPS